MFAIGHVFVLNEIKKSYVRVHTIQSHGQNFSATRLIATRRVTYATQKMTVADIIAKSETMMATLACLYIEPSRPQKIMLTDGEITALHTPRSC